jgi:hypothetical protein
MALNGRMTRRVVGMLEARLAEAGFGDIADPRKGGTKWSLDDLLKAAGLGIAAGCHSLAETENLTDDISPAMRKRFGIFRRVPDTTMRDAFVKVEPEELRRSLARQVASAHRRKALVPHGLPFGVVGMDGKVTSIPAWDESYAQKQTHGEGMGAHGAVRMYTAALVSSRAVVCLDAPAIPSATNEMGYFPKALDCLVESYKGKQLFRLIAADAGACSKANAEHVVDTHELDYLLALKMPQVELWREATRLLADRPPENADATSEDVVGTATLTRRVYITEEMAGYHDWEHLRVVLRIESERRDIKTGKVIEQKDEDVNRYYVCSLDRDELTDEQWLAVVRRYWGVENQCHHTWDTALREDAHPWILTKPQGTVVLMLLRRIVYNALALFRSVSLRSDERRETPWKTLLRWSYNALIAARDSDLAGMRTRDAVVATHGI